MSLSYRIDPRWLLTARQILSRLTRVLDDIVVVRGRYEPGHYATRLAFALALSLLIHAFVLSLQFGIAGFGLPGLALPWSERRAFSSDLRVRIVQASPTQSSNADLPRTELALRSPALAPIVAKPPAPRTFVARTPAKPKRAKRRSPRARAPAVARAVPRPVPSPKKQARKPNAQPELIAQAQPKQEAFSVPPPTVPERAPVIAAEPQPREVNKAAVPAPAQVAAVEEADRRAREEAEAKLEQRRLEEEARVQEQAQVEREAAELEALRQAEEAARQQAVALEQQRALELEAKRQQEAMEREEAERERVAALERQRALELEAKRQQEAREREEAERERVAALERQRALELEAKRQQEAREREEAERERVAALERQRALELKQKRQEEAKAAKLALELESLRRAEELARQTAEAARQRELEDKARAEALAAQARATALAAAEAGRKAAGTIGPPTISGRDLAARALSQLRSPGALSAGPQSPRSSSSSAPQQSSASPESPRRRAVVGGVIRDIGLRMYIESWRWKVERNGNLNYPSGARTRAAENPVVSVAIRQDGSVEEIRIHRSSGQRDLDEAVRRIVQLNAPYSVFPPDLARAYDVVEIRRVWVFGGTLRIAEEPN